MCKPVAPSERANCTVAGEVVSCVYAMPQQPATTMARWACGNGHKGQRQAILEGSDKAANPKCATDKTTCVSKC